VGAHKKTESDHNVGYAPPSSRGNALGARLVNTQGSDKSSGALKTEAKPIVSRGGMTCYS